MARTRSSSYEEKKERLLDVAARMFAESGYVVCRMEDIAERCDVSKSMLYHYFKRKEDLLYEILREHVTKLNDVIETYLATAPLVDSRDYLIDFLLGYLKISTQARERHAVTINDTRWLTDEQLRMQEALERRNTDLMIEILRRVNPNYKKDEYRVYAFLLIGMMNWVGLWYRESGRMTRAELHDRIGQLFLNGFMVEYKKSGRFR